MLYRNAHQTGGPGGRKTFDSSSTLVRARSLTWAIAGARGGTGKSLLASHLAVDLADRGWQVLLADLDWEGGNLRTMLGGEPGEHSVTDLAEGRGPDTPSALPVVRTGLRLIEGVNGFFDAPTPEARRGMLTLLQKLPCHHLVMDLGAGAAADVIVPFMGADVPLLVALPDPVGMENTFRFLGELVRQRVIEVASNTHAPSRSALRRLGRMRSLDDLPACVPDLCERVPRLVERVRADVAGRPLYLVLNQVRRLADLEAASQLEVVARRTLGCSIRTIGAIQYDERAWIGMRKGQAVAEWGQVSALGSEMHELLDALLGELGIGAENRLKGVALVERRDPRTVSVERSHAGGQ